MKQKSEYDLTERSLLFDRYFLYGEMSAGGEEALEWYRRAINTAKKGAEFDRRNYEYYYDTRKHCRSYEKKGLQYFEEAATCFRRAAELGNELAMMNYALYLFSFKQENEEALKWFFAASDAGLATADYQLSVFCKKGYCGVEPDEEKATLYESRYRARCEESERQLILAWDVDGDGSVLGRSYMYSCFRGFPFKEIYDTPYVKPSKWKYDEPCLQNNAPPLRIFFRRFAQILLAIRSAILRMLRKRSPANSDMNTKSV